MAPNSPEPIIGRLCYGTYWKIDPAGIKQWDAEQLLYQALQSTGKVQEDDDLSDYIDVLCEDYKAMVMIDGKSYTIFFAHVITDISTAENKFNEMSILHVMDLDKGTLRNDVKESVKGIIDTIPYKLREHFSRPQFFVAWGTI